jgi:Oligosaccharyl transferase STT3, N-terminal
VRLALLLVALIALAVAIWDVTIGGFYFTVLGLRVSSWESYKPFRIGLVALLAAAWLHDRAASPTGTTWHRLGRSTSVIAAAAGLLAITVAIRYGMFTAGGADNYGYVSQAMLWATGRAVAPDPLAALEPGLGRAVAPLGYQLGPRAGAIVPTYPAGLPLTMAAVSKIAGPGAVYYVVPLLGGLTVWLTYVLGTRVHQPLTGMIAAVLLACSPIFTCQTLAPMSDVPATAWWMLAWALALSTGRFAPIGSGLAVSAAVLTRPNLVPLAIVLFAVVALRTPRMPRLALFLAGAVPGCLIVAALNAYWYGSPLSSGYGQTLSLFSWSRWKLNLQHYFQWLIDLHTVGIVLAFVAPVATRAKHSVAMVTFFFLLFASYLWYVVFETWPALRLLLPAIPLLFILASAVVVRIVEALPVAFRTATVLIVCTLVPIWYVSKSTSLGVFSVGRSEHRYMAVGRYVARALPPNAAVLSMIHSGSVRLYSGRPTVRWDIIPADTLDGNLELLRSNGYYPYLLLDDWELPLFRERFSTSSQYGRLDWPAAFAYTDLNDVRVYDFADRHRYLAGEPIITQSVPLIDRPVSTVIHGANNADASRY